MQNTTYYNLKKPEGTDFYNIENENDNMDIIDAELKEHDDAISELNTKIGWRTLWTGSITANGTATLSETAGLYFIRTANAAGETASFGGFFLPNLSGTNAYYFPIMLGAVSTYVRVQISGKTLTVLSVGNAGVYIKAVYGIA